MSFKLHVHVRVSLVIVALIGEFESFTHHDIIVSDEDEPVVVREWLC